MLTIPIKALSTNRLFQGRRFKTKEYDAFMQAALYFAPKAPMVKGAVSAQFDFFIKTATRSDLDNLLKSTLDLCVKAGYLEDDRFVFHLTARKFKVEDEAKERIELRIKPLKEKKMKRERTRAGLKAALNEINEI